MGYTSCFDVRSVSRENGCYKANVDVVVCFGDYADYDFYGERRTERVNKWDRFMDAEYVVYLDEDDLSLVDVDMIGWSHDSGYEDDAERWELYGDDFDTMVVAVKMEISRRNKEDVA